MNYCTYELTVIITWTIARDVSDTLIFSFNYDSQPSEWLLRVDFEEVNQAFDILAEQLLDEVCLRDDHIRLWVSILKSYCSFDNLVGLVGNHYFE